MKRLLSVLITILFILTLFIACSGRPPEQATAIQNPTSTISQEMKPTISQGGGVPVPGDPLTGSGMVSRTLLTFDDLISGSSPAPVDDNAFALPAEAAIPKNTFEGTLHLVNNASSGGSKIYVDTQRIFGSADQPIKHLPDFTYQFVQNGSHLIPVNQGLAYTGSLYWNYIIGPGRVWNEKGDNGYSRASFPFALIEYNQNCTHNGVMMFLFNAAGVSQVRYQITQETCLYAKFDFWGQLIATYTPHRVENAMKIMNDHANEVANRLPTKPMDALAADYPGADLNLSKFGSGITAEDMTFYGIFINGVNYVSACRTRHGSYAFCDAMRAPSYSSAKSAMAGVALMRLGQKYGQGVYDLLIKDYVPEFASSAGLWTNVTFNNTLDMATGNYSLKGYDADESNNMDPFLMAVPYSAKISEAFHFPNKATPGSLWVYHTSDAFIAGRAMNNYLVAQGGGNDIFNLLRDEVYIPAKMSAGFMTTLRTDNSPSGVPFSGYGLFWTQDDLAKMAKLLNNDHGMAGGRQVLEPGMLDDTMQKNAADRGVTTTGIMPFLYNNGFWAAPPAEFPQFTCPTYIPFMSGYGGITIAMAPNGATYYTISDNNEFDWYDAIDETNKISPMCP